MRDYLGSVLVLSIILMCAAADEECGPFDPFGDCGGGGGGGVMPTLPPVVEAAIGQRCPPAWFQEGEKCYWFSRKQSTVNVAQSFCAEREGQLVMIKDQAEVDIIKRLRNDNGHTNKNYWVGGALGKMSSRTQCVNMASKGQGYTFNTNPCGQSLDYICETPLQPICDEGWSKNHMTCIKFVDAPFSSWSMARQACKEMGADLAEVKYLAEAQRIEAIRAKIGKTVRAYWTGAIQDRAKSTNFRYTDNTPLNLKALWFPGEPNNWRSPSRMCVALGTQANNLKMTDRPCTTKLSFLCERNDH